MNQVRRLVALVMLLALLSGLGGCISCIPQYVAPPQGPVPSKYPQGHDPYIPLDHNPSLFNPWDVIRSVAAPLLYGPPR